MINIIMNGIGLIKEILKIYASYTLGMFVLMPLVVVRTDDRIYISVEEMVLLGLMMVWGVYSIL
jgi:hypothetical protein